MEGSVNYTTRVQNHRNQRSCCRKTKNMALRFGFSPNIVAGNVPGGPRGSLFFRAPWATIELRNLQCIHCKHDEFLNSLSVFCLCWGGAVGADFSKGRPCECQTGDTHFKPLACYGNSLRPPVSTCSTIPHVCVCVSSFEKPGLGWQGKPAAHQCSSLSQSTTGPTATSRSRSHPKPEAQRACCFCPWRKQRCCHRCLPHPSLNTGEAFRKRREFTSMLASLAWWFGHMMGFWDPNLPLALVSHAAIWNPNLDHCEKRRSCSNRLVQSEDSATLYISKIKVIYLFQRQ